MYDFILRILRPLIRFVGKLHSPFSHKKINGKHYYLLRDNIKVGDVFLTRTHGELSNLINPSEVKHAAIYLGRIFNNEICYVMEAVGKGAVFTDLVTFMTSKDILVLCEPKFVRGDVEVFRQKLVKGAVQFKGVKYDYFFGFGVNALYCFELVAECFKTVYPDLQLRKNEIIKNKYIYDENTYLKSDLFSVLYDSRKS